MKAVSLDRRCTARLVPSPTKLPARRPAESSRASLARGSESSGAGGRSSSSRPRNRPAPPQPAAAPASRIRPKASAPREIGPAGRDMAGNVPGAWVQRKGEPPGGT